MDVPCCAKVLIFTLVLLLIDFTNLAKAENYKETVYNYDSYEYPGYEYPDSKSTCSFFFMLVQIIFYNRFSICY